MTSILSEAAEIVAGVRQEQYGDPVDVHTRIGQAWAGILGLPEVTPKEVALCMAALKLVREASPRTGLRDNFVDAAGYVQIARWCSEADADEEAREDADFSGAPLTSITYDEPCQSKFDKQARIFDEGFHPAAVEGVGPTDAEREAFWADLGRVEEGPAHDGGDESKLRPGVRIRVNDTLNWLVALSPGAVGTVLRRNVNSLTVRDDYWDVRIDGDHAFETYCLLESEMDRA